MTLVNALLIGFLLGLIGLSELRSPV